MELISQRDVSSVKLFTTEMSEDELDVYENCMRYIYQNLPSDEIEQVTGATVGELLSMLEDVAHLLTKHSSIRRSSDGYSG